MAHLNRDGSLWLGGDGMEDWAKETLDFDSDNAEDLRRELAALGIDIQEFKARPAYWAALDSGKYPWLADL